MLSKALTLSPLLMRAEIRRDNVDEPSGTTWKVNVVRTPTMSLLYAQLKSETDAATAQVLVGMVIERRREKTKRLKEEEIKEWVTRFCEDAAYDLARRTLSVMGGMAEADLALPIVPPETDVEYRDADEEPDDEPEV